MVVFILLPNVSAAQSWTSTDVGAVGQAGSASENAGAWTVHGSGADIWGTSDAFQFVHHTVSGSGSLTVRVDDLQNTSAFAKAGLMIRASLTADAAMAILDAKPDGGIEFMTRVGSGDSVRYVTGTPLQFPVWLQLTWDAGSIRASTASDGSNWTLLGTGGIVLPSAPEGGLAVTSHDNNQLTTAHFEQLSVGTVGTPEWTAVSVGSEGLPGNAAENNGVWTIHGGGSDIWGTADNFELVYRTTTSIPAYVSARIDDLQNTDPFAKAGVMMRASAGDSAPTVVLDVRPGGGLEFMARRHQGDSMMYLGGGTVVAFPVWLRLAWTDNDDQTLSVAPMFSSDGVNWTEVASAATIDDPNYAVQYVVGAAVTSHNTQQLTTAHLDHLTLLGAGMESTDVGVTNRPGNASAVGDAFEIQGAGSDIWGTADSFQFVHGAPVASPDSFFTSRVVRLDNTNPFAKAGLMFRDTLDPNAASVILDARPDGSVEFMARPCAGCDTTFVAAGKIAFPSHLSLSKEGSTYTARVYSTNPKDAIVIGSVSVSMAAPYAGYAVTSHDPHTITTAVFDNPPE